MPITSLSPLDGRYESKVSELKPYSSEYALIKYRIIVEISFFIALSEEPKIKEVGKFSKKELSVLSNIITNFSPKEAEKVKNIEKTTNHDVKAVEYYIKEQLKNTSLKKHLEFIHFACTSEDINNLSYGMMLKDSITKVILPNINEVYKTLLKLAKKWKHIPLLSRTHGQPASPTTVGKEIYVICKRLENQINQLKNQIFLGKLNGAVGNYNAHIVAYPEVNWIKFSGKFIKKLGMTPNLITTQIETHDYMAEVFDTITRLNTVLLNLNRDIWLYISNKVFKQKLKEGEIGSSTMPHKVNPIDFENSEGNIGLANSLLQYMSKKLPISRLQRDLSDSTVQRNIGTAFGYSLLAYKSTLKGLNKLGINQEAILKELEDNVEVLAEAIQTVMRKHKIKNPYEKLKKLTRGKKITLKNIHVFIDSLELPKQEKDNLKKLTPAKYIGIAEKLVGI